ncbi:hypothetical protein AL062_24505 [Pseudomonas syringae pv. syringae]|nr:hypothetical protein AL062_24505 [Pseudomonas syringae pv. syringae]RXT63364.1 hypothetical protein B1F74_15095 [Pseudomonas syringae]
MEMIVGQLARTNRPQVIRYVIFWLAQIGSTNFKTTNWKNPMSIKPDKTYRFVKSGNLVRTAVANVYGGYSNWVVARIDSGKEMIVSGRAFIDPNHPDWS